MLTKAGSCIAKGILSEMCEEYTCICQDYDPGEGWREVYDLIVANLPEDEKQNLPYPPST